MNILHKLKRKVDSWRWSHLKDLWVKYGLPFLIIFIAWEIVEDVVFPAIFYLLGTHVNEAFYVGITRSLGFMLAPNCCSDTLGNLLFRN